MSTRAFAASVTTAGLRVMFVGVSYRMIFDEQKKELSFMLNSGSMLLLRITECSLETAVSFGNDLGLERSKDDPNRWSTFEDALNFSPSRATELALYHSGLVLRIVRSEGGCRVFFVPRNRGGIMEILKRAIGNEGEGER